jgi:RNase P subunit RPR2
MSRWTCICNDCREEIEPELDQCEKLNSSGTEVTYWVPVCPECGWQLDNEQSLEWFKNQQEKGN